MLKKMTNKVMRKIGLLVAGVSASGLALAEPPKAVDYSSLTNTVSFGGVMPAVLGVCASLATLYVGIKGAKIVLAMLRGR